MTLRFAYYTGMITGTAGPLFMFAMDASAGRIDWRWWQVNAICATLGILLGIPFTRALARRPR